MTISAAGITSAIDWEQDADGVVILTLNARGRSANTMDDDYLESMDAVLERLEAELDRIVGVIIASAKSTFFAGADLREVLSWGPGNAAVAAAFATRVKRQLRRLETLGRPTVAAISGAALGGGLEIALATHHRIIAQGRGTVVGFPEVSLGLLPGAGGVTRTVRMLGLGAALPEVLLSAARFGPDRAVEIGLIDEVVATVPELIPAAKAWIAANPGADQPWDRPGYRMPGLDPASPTFRSFVGTIPASLRQRTKGAPAAAERAIIAAAAEGAAVDLDSAFTIETRYFVGLVVSDTAKNLIKSRFLDLQAVNAGASRPTEIPTSTVRRVAVLGAGMMGAAIAYVSAEAGIEVVLKDVTQEAADRGKAHSEQLVARALARGRMSEATGEALLARITPTTAAADVAGADFVVEAVFESIELKQQVFQEIEAAVAPNAVLGSNTSSLPISRLATGVGEAERFIGVHFFSPVDRMPLVELVVGRETSDTTLARAFDFARQIGKTPIVVNDSRGFFTSRVITTFVNEAIAALGEGVEPAMIEQAALQAGYPAGPLQLIDELTLTLPRDVRQQAEAASEGGRASWVDHGSASVIDRMIDVFDRPGRAAGRGFYQYAPDGSREQLWVGLRTEFHTHDTGVSFDDLKERMLFAEALESVRCLDENVLRSVLDGNVGSLLGIGFPAWTGGVFRYINSYPGGIARFVERAEELAIRYGTHFQPPASLLARAATGQQYD